MAHVRHLGRPQFGKLAFEGQWEQALCFDPGLSRPEAVALLNGSTEVACEAFFTGGFVGVRRYGTADEVLTFVLGFARAMSADDFTQALRDLGVPVGERLLFAEIGAEGAWHSVGPVRVPDDLDALESALAGSVLVRDRDHSKYVEFAFDNGDGTTHWFAQDVSRAGEVDVAAVRAACEDVRKDHPLRR
ncbi:MAG: hypothetical protein V9E82_07075 [Candidatus Nanopelagicales bacterium]